MAAQPLPEDRYRPSFERTLEHVKQQVKCIDEADLLCGPAGTRTGLRKMGQEWFAICPLPGPLLLPRLRPGRGRAGATPARPRLHKRR
jgi:hypothetical protein